MSQPRILVAPSILAADFSRLGAETRRAVRAGGDWLHVDVMDGHFVPNLTMGPVVVGGVRRATRRYVDVHLMIENPGAWVEAFAQAGADGITVHVEAMEPPARRSSLGRRPGAPAPRGWYLRRRPSREALARARAVLRRIRRLGCRAGIALNPLTPVSAVAPVLGGADLALAMTVWPGFGGQKFLDAVLPKVAELRKIGGVDLRVQVDGGVEPATAGRAAAAGADVLVAGTSAFGARDMGAAVRGLRRAGEAGRRRCEA